MEAGTQASFFVHSCLLLWLFSKSISFAFFGSLVVHQAAVQLNSQCGGAASVAFPFLAPVSSKIVMRAQ